MINTLSVLGDGHRLKAARPHHEPPEDYCEQLSQIFIQMIYLDLKFLLFAGFSF